MSVYWNPPKHFCEESCFIPSGWTLLLNSTVRSADRSCVDESGYCRSSLMEHRIWIVMEILCLWSPLSLMPNNGGKYKNTFSREIVWALPVPFRTRLGRKWCVADRRSDRQINDTSSIDNYSMEVWSGLGNIWMFVISRCDHLTWIV